jgi:hypothetical protein
MKGRSPMAKLPAKPSPSKEITDSRHLQDQSRNEQQKSYLLNEVSRLRCKEAADSHAANDSLRAESIRVRDTARSLRRREK